MPYFRGKLANAELKKWLEVYERYLLFLGDIKYNLDVYQLIGGYVKSGGTHAGGDAFDIGQTSTKAIKAARDNGAPATWHRPYNWDRDGGISHTHGAISGGGHATAALLRQIADVKRGLNGLANRGRDTGPSLSSAAKNRNYRQGIARMEKAMKPRKIIPISWYVHVDRSFPYSQPKVSEKYRQKGSVGYGGKLRIRETKVVYGTMWGRTTGNRWWILGKGRAGKTKPPKRRPSYGYGEVGTIRIHSWNVAAQASDALKKTWLGRRADETAAEITASGVDVAAIQESGSGEYLDKFESAIESHPDYVVVNGGKNWRQIVRNIKTTKWVSGVVFTLSKKHDSDGNQVQCVALESHGQRVGILNMHGDISATADEQAEQVAEAVERALKWFTEQGVFWRNVTLCMDTNNRTGEVLKALADMGFSPVLAVAEQTKNATLRTTNGWKASGSNTLPTGQNGIDGIFVFQGVRVTDAANVVPLEKPLTDHNKQTCLRYVYKPTESLWYVYKPTERN